jgi:hypothetical protein
MECGKPKGAFFFCGKLRRAGKGENIFTGGDPVDLRKDGDKINI